MKNNGGTFSSSYYVGEKISTEQPVKLRNYALKCFRYSPPLKIKQNHQTWFKKKKPLLCTKLFLILNLALTFKIATTRVNRPSQLNHYKLSRRVQTNILGADYSQLS